MPDASYLHTDDQPDRPEQVAVDNGVSYLVGDTVDVVHDIPDGSISLVTCSPPFIALRSYLPPDHADKDREIGSEPNPGAFLNRLLGLTAEWGRVLAPWGSIAIELGDTYAGSGGVSDTNSSMSAAVLEANATVTGAMKNRVGGGWPRPKCLALIPQAYAMSLAYGFNVITGQPSPAGQWLVRNQVVWHRPNPAVGALGDKFRPSTSYITIATRSARRWFDLTAVRKKAIDQRYRTTNGSKMVAGDATEVMTANYQQRVPSHAAGAPPLDAWFDSHDTWTLTTQPSQLAHYAMWPAKLAERLILSMCPAEVCTTCGEPRRRIEHAANAVGTAHRTNRNAPTVHSRGDAMLSSTHVPDVSERVTTGWTDCGHDTFEPGTVLDPFAGTGTTLAVAALHGRRAIGIDIDERNRRMYRERRAECAKALFGSTPELPGQADLFSELAS